MRASDAGNRDDARRGAGGPAPGLDRLVAEIARRAAADPEGRWRIGSDETARMLGVDLVTFWREANDLRRRISFGDAVDGFTQDSVGDLVTLLERLAGPSAEEALAAAGLFLPHRSGAEIAERLQRACRDLAAAHEIRADDLEGMVRHTGSVRRAIDLYLRTHVDLESVVAACASAWAAEAGLPAAGEATARRWLRHLFAKHVLEQRALFTLLEERLRAAAAEAGHVDPEDREGDREGERARGEARGEARGRAGAGRAFGRDGSRGGQRRAWALGVMGFAAGRAPEAAELRLRYRQLMMRHHPDADPAGLERCKDVNAAYALLIASSMSG